MGVDRCVRALAEQDFTGRRSIAKAGGEVNDVADRAVVVTTLEADSPKGCIAGGDADAKTEVVAAFFPLVGEGFESFAYRNSGTDRDVLMIRNGDWVIEKRHYSVAGKVLDGALVRDDQLDHRRLVLAQHAKHLLRIGVLREGREPTHVAEERRDLSPVGGEEPLAFVGREQVRHVRRESRQLLSLPSNGLE